jgi:hypothetical protein
MHRRQFHYPAFLFSRIVVLLRIVTHAQPSVFVPMRCRFGDYLHELHIIVCLIRYQVSVVVRQDSSCIIAHVM